MIEDCSGPYGGRISDSEMARRSRLEERFGAFADVPLRDGGVRRFKIYGDSAYAQSDFIERPYSRTTATPAQLNFNALMSRVRVSVEHLIGSVTQVFPSLDMVKYQRSGQTVVGMTFLVAVIVRNFLTCVRGGNQVSDFFRIPPPTLQEFARARPDVNPRVQELRDLGLEAIELEADEELSDSDGEL